MRSAPTASRRSAACRNPADSRRVGATHADCERADAKPAATPAARNAANGIELAGTFHGRDRCALSPAHALMDAVRRRLVSLL